MTAGHAMCSRIAVATLLAAVVVSSACSKPKPQAQGQGQGQAEHLTKGDEPGRSREAGFSFVPPKGWQPREMPGLKFKPVLGTPEDGFAPNINIVDEAFGGPLDTYVNANLENMQKMMPGFVNVSTEAFRSDDGLDAKKLTTESDQNNMHMRQLFYMFPGNGRYFVVTCSDLREHKGKHDTECDASAKTFRLD